MSENYVLVTYRGNYADEFDVKVHWLTSKKSWDEFNELLGTVPDDALDGEEFYFGTNEYFDIDGGLKQFLRKCEVQEVTAGEFAVLQKFFPGETGLLELFSRIIEAIQEFKKEEEEEKE